MATRPRAASAKTSAGAVITLLLFGALMWWYFGGGMTSQVNQTMQGINNQVASDAERQYDIAKRNGSAIDACVHAGLVAASYLQAQNEPSYQRWKRVEKADCAAAGIPR
jgi:hypothetical protein